MYMSLFTYLFPAAHSSATPASARRAPRAIARSPALPGPSPPTKMTQPNLRRLLLRTSS